MATFLIKLLTAKAFERVAKKVLIAVLRNLSKRTTNDIDDTAVEALAEALGEK